MSAYSYKLVNEESVSAVTATPSVQLGTRRLYNGAEYVYVYNAGVTAAVGYGMIASANSGYSCVVTAVYGSTLFGVVQNADLQASSYGWILTRGLAASCYSAQGQISLNSPVVLYTNGSFMLANTSATGIAACIAKCGVATQSIASAATGKIWVNATI